jgi:hypothetical protein
MIKQHGVQMLEFDIMCEHAQCAVCTRCFLFGNILLLSPFYATYFMPLCCYASAYLLHI